MQLKGIPERIWLQYHGDADPADYPEDQYPDDSEVSWCYEPIFEHDIEYVTVDYHQKKMDEYAQQYKEMLETQNALAEAEATIQRLREINDQLRYDDANE